MKKLILISVKNADEIFEDFSSSARLPTQPCCRKARRTTKRRAKKTEKMSMFLAEISIICVLLLCCFLTGCGGRSGNTITVASKTFTENILLSEMYAQLIENRTGLEVVRLQPFGSTAVCFTAIEQGEIDLYVDYTGTVYNEILLLEYNPELSAGEVFETVEQKLLESYGITVYPPPGLNNTFALAMQKDKASALGLEKTSDLKDASKKLVFGANLLFYSRVSDGYDAMLQKYGLEFGSSVKMDTDLLYEAVHAGNVDVMVVYATDSQLNKYDMVLLEDDLNLFPVYEAVPLVRGSVLKEHPELGEVLGLLEDLIDDECMQSLNYRVDVENIPPHDVAYEFLSEMKLLSGG